MRENCLLFSSTSLKGDFGCRRWVHLNAAGLDLRCDSIENTLLVHRKELRCSALLLRYCAIPDQYPKEHEGRPKKSSPREADSVFHRRMIRSRCCAAVMCGTCTMVWSSRWLLKVSPH